jgi:hypothetical protein
MKNKIGLETILGGIFGIIAIIAIVVQMGIEGYSSEAVWNGIKDIAGTLVAVMVFVVAIKSFVVSRPKNLNEILEANLNRFEEKSLPLVFRVSDFKPTEGYVQGFAILQNFDEFPTLACSLVKGDNTYLKYQSQNNRTTGKFIDLPSVAEMLSSDFKVRFKFIDSNVYEEQYKTTMKLAILNKFGEYTCSNITSNFTVSVPKIASIQDIEKIISLFEFVITLYQIGNRGTKTKNEN